MDSEPNASLPISPGKDVQGDFAQFKNFMTRLMAVPHSEVKAKLDAEKKSEEAEEI